MQKTTDPARAPKGVPAGGQFTAEHKSEPASSLPVPADDGTPVSLDHLIFREPGDNSSGMIFIGEDEHGDSDLGMIDVEYNPSTGKYLAAATAGHFSNDNDDFTDDFLVGEYDIVPTDDGDHIVAQAILDPKLHDSGDITEQLHQQSHIDRALADQRSGGLDRKLDEYRRA